MSEKKRITDLPEASNLYNSDVFVIDSEESEQTAKISLKQLTSSIIDQIDFDSFKTKILNSIYPVGSVYITFESNDPSEIFGGTWELVKDQFLLASGDSHLLGETGGTENVKLTANECGLRTHTHSFTTPTVIVGSHTHGAGADGERLLSYNYSTTKAGVGEIAVSKASSGSYVTPYINTTKGDWVGRDYTSASTVSVTLNGGSVNEAIPNTGSSDGEAINAHENMPPYIVVNVWRRTA